MSEFERSVRDEADAAKIQKRPEHGHQKDEAERSTVDRQGSDRHASWLKEWRSLRSDVSDQHGAHNRNVMIRELQDKIAHTPAMTLVGLQAQAELISELAWNDVVAATARQLLWGIRRLQRDGEDRR